MLPDLVADALERARRPRRHRAGRSGHRVAGRLAGRPSGRLTASARGPTASRRPGPTSECPRAGRGSRRSAAAAVSSRSHGSAIRSCSRRSDANRSSGAGQRRSSAPESVRQQDPRVDDGRVGEPARRLTRGRTGRPAPAAGRGPMPAAAGRRRSCAGRVPRRAPGSATRSAAPASAASSTTSGPPRAAPPVGSAATTTGRASSRARTRAAGPGPIQPRPRAAEQQEIERAVDIDTEPPASPQVRDGDAGRSRPASAAGHCRSRGPAGPGARLPPGRSRRRRPSSGRSRAPPAPPRLRPRRGRDGRRPSPAGWRPSPGRRGRRRRHSAASPRSRRPNGVSSGGPETIRAADAPAARKPTRWRSARAARAAETAASSGPAAGPGLRVQDERADVAGGHAGPSLDGGSRTTVGERRVRAYVGLGSNVGDAPATLAWAVDALGGPARASRLRGVSPLYVTAPWGVTDQPDFHNAVVALDVPAGPDPAAGALALLGQLKTLERLAGRRPGRRWGPRELDLDLLVFGRHRIAVERPPEARSNDAEPDPAKAARRLEVPHRDAGERLFVLAPLADLAAAARAAGLGRDDRDAPATRWRRRRRPAPSDRSAAGIPRAAAGPDEYAGVRPPAPTIERADGSSTTGPGTRTEDHDDHDRLRRDARAVPPDRPARLVRRGRGRRLRGRLHGQRALPPVDAAAGPERVRLGVHGRARPADEPRSSGPRSPAPASATTRRSSPTRRRRSGRCTRAASTWASAPARRSTSTSSAACGRRSAIRSAMMFESIEIINKLFTGKVVKHKGEYFTLESAKLYTRPETAGARSTSRRPGRSTPRRPASSPTGSSPSARPTRRSGCSGASSRRAPARPARTRTRRPKMLQIHISWAPHRRGSRSRTRCVEWPNGGMPFPKQDIKNPEDFAAMAKLVRPEDFKNRVLMTQRPRGPHRAHPALRRHGLRRGPPPQRRAQPGRVHRGVRQGGPAEPAPGLSESAVRRGPSARR